MKLPELKIGDKVATVPIVQGGMAIRLDLASLTASFFSRRKRKLDSFRFNGCTLSYTKRKATRNEVNPNC